MFEKRNKMVKSHFWGVSRDPVLYFDKTMSLDHVKACLLASVPAQKQPSLTFKFQESRSEESERERRKTDRERFSHAQYSL
jgi:hypothetical protein